MPAVRVQQPHPHSANASSASYNLHRESPNSDSSKSSSLSMADGRQRKRLHKSNPEPTPSTTLPRSSSIRDPRSPPKNRQASYRNQRKPSVNRATTDYSSNARSSFIPPSRTTSNVDSKAREPNQRSGQADNNVTTFYAFGANNDDGSERIDDPFDFQPSVNLEDVHRSIIDTDQLSQFPAPGRKVSNGSLASTSSSSTRKSTMDFTQQPPTAPASMLRRPSVNRYGSIRGSNTDQSSQSRGRRTSFTGTAASRSTSSTYRKASATIEPGNSMRGSRRRLSINNSASNPPMPRKEYHEAGGYSNVSSDVESKVPMSSRSAKSKSLQPPPRQQNQQLNPARTPEHYRASVAFPPKSPKSPASKLGTPGKNGTPGSAASRRISYIPHASGLGARTVSPTDARRLKRLSTIVNTPPPPAIPAAVESERSAPASPTIMPRKSATPSSSRTTPDTKRKSYSSGLSISSTSTSARTSVGSLQPKLALNLGSSRLPRPPQLEREDEDIPPVPPLPKNLTSPTASTSTDSTPLSTAKSTTSTFAPRFSSLPPAHGVDSDSTEQETVDRDSPISILKSGSSHFAPRKSSLTYDGIVDSVELPQEADAAEDVEMDENKDEPGFTRLSPRIDKPKTDRETRRKRGMTMGGLSSGQNSNQTLEQKSSSSSLRKKDLVPIRLPPLNLLPLSTPTIARVNALAPASDSEELTPPPKVGTKTPTTPLTASKVSFFGRRDKEAGSPYHAYQRSTSSFNAPEDSPSSLSIRAGSSASSGIPISTGGSRLGRQTASPYISTSLPKGTPTPAMQDQGSSKTKRAPSRDKSKARKSQESLRSVPVVEESPVEPPSTGSSIRRKLSLNWKKSGQGKSSHAANERAEEYQGPPPKYDAMPPPRLPSSATWAGPLTTPSPVKTTQAPVTSSRTKRQSTIGGGVSLTQHDRTRSDSWGTAGSPRKEKKVEEKPPAPPAKSTASSILSPMTKMLGSKTSLGHLRTRGHTNNNNSSMDADDLIAEEEMKKLSSKKKNLDQAAHELEELKKRAGPKERMSPQQVLRAGVLNIFERGEIVDYPDIYFTGLTDAKKIVGDLKATTLPNFGYDDDRGDYNIVKGDHLVYRYEVVDVLGKGSFGQVVRCIDHKTGVLVAVKIIRNKKRFHAQALVEVNILQKLKDWDPQQKHSLINFTQSFYFRGHLCISTELLGMNLYEFIKSNDFRGFSLRLIRRFTKQMLSSLILLKGKKVIHCDLKPENILLAHPAKSEIKVIDFGSSCFENERVYTYIQSRFYRSPEVILGMTYGMPIDMWSLGCILAELFTGYPIFPGENEQEQLACIMEVFGPPEKHLIEKSTRKKLFFDSHGKPRMIVSSKGRRRRPSSKTLQSALRCDDEAFLDFIARCLRWDPEKRLKPDEALHHDFITGKKTRNRTGTYNASAAAAAATTSSSDDRKRYHSASYTASVSRPLPDPPGAKKTTNSSPMKMVQSASQPKRHVSNVATTSTAVKRNSLGAPIGGGSALPRVATGSNSNRSASGKIPTPSSQGRSSGRGTAGSIRLVKEEAGNTSSSGGEGRRR